MVYSIPARARLISSQATPYCFSPTESVNPLMVLRPNTVLLDWLALLHAQPEAQQHWAKRSWPMSRSSEANFLHATM